jgi:hypothetical protein
MVMLRALTPESAVRVRGAPHLPPVAQWTEPDTPKVGRGFESRPEDASLGSSTERATVLPRGLHVRVVPEGLHRSRLTGRAPGFYPGLTGIETSGRHSTVKYIDAGVVERLPHWAHDPEMPFESDARHEVRPGTRSAGVSTAHTPWPTVKPW